MKLARSFAVEIFPLVFQRRLQVFASRTSSDQYWNPSNQSGVASSAWPAFRSGGSASRNAVRNWTTAASASSSVGLSARAMAGASISSVTQITRDAFIVDGA